MGGSSGFCSKVKHLCREVKPGQASGGVCSAIDADAVLVDMSVLDYRLRSVDKLLAVRIFEAGGGDEGIDGVVTEYADRLDALLRNAHLPCNTSTELVFEGASKKSNRRAAKNAARRAKRLNTALRRAFNPSVRDVHKSTARKVIASQMGRPPFWFTVRAAKVLQQRGWTTVVCPQPLQADTYIISRAQQLKSSNGKDVVVWSVDRDFLALDPTSSITSILFERWGSVLALSKEAVLAELDCDAEQLRKAYCFGGCDDIEVKINGLGFATALKLARDSDKALMDAGGVDSARITRAIGDMDKAVATALATVESGISVDEHTPSMLDTFLDERHQDGCLRRAQLAAKVRAMRSEGWAPPTATTTEPPTRAGTRSERLRIERQHVANNKRKVIPFVIPTHNLFSVLDMEECATGKCQATLSRHAAVTHVVSSCLPAEPGPGSLTAETASSSGPSNARALKKDGAGDAQDAVVAVVDGAPESPPIDPVTEGCTMDEDDHPVPLTPAPSSIAAAVASTGATAFRPLRDLALFVGRTVSVAALRPLRDLAFFVGRAVSGCALLSAGGAEQASVSGDAKKRKPNGNKDVWKGVPVKQYNPVTRRLGTIEKLVNPSIPELVAGMGEGVTAHKSLFNTYLLNANKALRFALEVRCFSISLHDDP